MYGCVYLSECGGGGGESIYISNLELNVHFLSYKLNQSPFCFIFRLGVLPN